MWLLKGRLLTATHLLWALLVCRPPAKRPTVRQRASRETCVLTRSPGSLLSPGLPPRPPFNVGTYFNNDAMCLRALRRRQFFFICPLAKLTATLRLHCSFFFFLFHLMLFATVITVAWNSMVVQKTL